jgi:signal transduction histidine kinase/streptogramin lyase
MASTRMWGSPLTLLILLLTTPAWGLNPSSDLHQYAHSAWALRDGAFRGYPRALAQTTDGYLWLGTEFGVLRFDGVRFAPWQPPAGQTLPSSSIVSLLATHDGSLWIGTDRGLARWDAGTLNTFSALVGQHIATLVEDREGTIWAGTSAGLDGSAKLCAIQNARATCDGADGAFGRFVSALLEDAHRSLWVGAATGLWRWKPGPPRRYPIQGASPEIHSMIETPNDRVLIAINREIKQMAQGTVGAYLPQSPDSPLKPTTLLRDRDGGLWIGTQDQGVLHLHHGKTERFTHADGLSGDFVSAVYEDHEGTVWVATLNGLDRFRDFAVTTLSTQNGLSSESVLSVLASRDGSLWMATANGVNRWIDGHITVERPGSGVANDVAASLFQDSRGDVWVASLQGLAYQKGRQFAVVPAMSGGHVHAMAEDTANNLWVSDQERGLIRLRGQRLVEMIPWAQFGGRSARAMVADPVDGGLWLGFFQGGVSYVKDGRVTMTYTAADGLGAGPVTDVYLDHGGALWAATANGLGRVKDGTVATFTSKNGLPCDAVLWVTQDDALSFWLYTACGLVRIAGADMDAWAVGAKQTIPITLYDALDGVPSHTGNGGYGPKVAKSADGRLWFASYDGVGVIDPRHLAFNALVPPVHIEQVTADRQIYDASSARRLPSGVRDVRIDYTALSLVAPEKVRFRYMLEGRDREWVDAGSRRQAFYTDLPPRQYRFRVMASNNDGVWNQEGDMWTLTILPAFYQTNAFRITFALFVMGVLWGAHRARLRRLARQLNVRFEDRLAERTRIAQELHDTLLQGFLSVSMHLHVMVDEIVDHPLKLKLEAILGRISHVVEEGRLTVQGLRASDSVEDELEHALTRDGEALRGEQGVVIRVRVEGRRRGINPLVKDEVYRICREALANVFRHARATHVEVTIAYTPRHLRVQVVDDGRGMAPEVVESGTTGHWGIPGMRERAERIGATLKLWSRLNAGTSVDLSVPGKVAFQQRAATGKARWSWRP